MVNGGQFTALVIEFNDLDGERSGDVCEFAGLLLDGFRVALVKAQDVCPAAALIELEQVVFGGAHTERS